MRNQFEIDAEADPQKLIAITHYGTTSTNKQGETGFRVYLRNSSSREIQTMTFHVQAYGEDGNPIGNSKETNSKALYFNQELKPGTGAHPMWPKVWKQNEWRQGASITCAIIDMVEITYTDGTKTLLPKQALDIMTYNPKCLSLDGAEFNFDTF
ncbi:hypothetical protein [Photobacterium sp. DNB22_13_2]